MSNLQTVKGRCVSWIVASPWIVNFIGKDVSVYSILPRSKHVKGHLLRIMCIWNVSGQVVHDLRVWLWLWSSSIENLPGGILAVPSWESLASNTCRQAILCCAILVLTSKHSRVTSRSGESCWRCITCAKSPTSSSNTTTFPSAAAPAAPKCLQALQSDAKAYPWSCACQLRWIAPKIRIWHRWQRVFCAMSALESLANWAENHQFAQFSIPDFH